MDDLIFRLSQGDHPVEISLRPERNAVALKRRIDEYGFIHIKFTDTKGGTELGVRLDKSESIWAPEDFDRGAGTIRIAGHLKLNFVAVKCIAEIDLETLAGVGHLEVI